MIARRLGAAALAVLTLAGCGSARMYRLAPGSPAPPSGMVTLSRPVSFTFTLDPFQSARGIRILGAGTLARRTSITRTVDGGFILTLSHSSYTFTAGAIPGVGDPPFSVSLTLGDASGARMTLGDLDLNLEHRGALIADSMFRSAGALSGSLAFVTVARIVDWGEVSYRRLASGGEAVRIDGVRLVVTRAGVVLLDQALPLETWAPGQPFATLSFRGRS